MKVTAKCHNYSGCLRAYRGEEIELPPDAPAVCPECGQPVTNAKGGGSAWKHVGLALAIVAIGAGAFLLRPLFSDKTPPQARAGTGEEQLRNLAPTEARPAAQPDRTAAPAEPPTAVTAPQKIDLSAASAESRQVKAEVLTRIDLMPTISQQNKDKLYNSVERARSMGKLLTIPFASGKTAIGGGDIDALKTHLDSPEIRKLRDDPTAVFVILGYADPKGDQKKNLAISQTRADSVLAAMRDRCGVVNVMHSVAMGGSTLVDAENLEKNRIVEVWAVLP